jgi:uncharacterized protein involved in outer membrane biogenesis
VTFAIALVLGLFLFRPGANRLKLRISSSISSALARRVEIGGVQLQVLPQPGFVLSDFSVADDPAYGSEPMLRAPEVTAVIRLTSLLRGRLEIARLSLTDPSLNLVRGPSGRWNIEDLLERSSHIAVAPTTKRRLEPRPGFPYIEATGGRINFKFRAEKKPGVLTDSKFSLWQDSENTWGMQLRGRPLRTDLNLSDTGEMTVSGTWARAGTLRETPLKFSLQWEDAQLGQLTKLFSGNDKGWRGTATARLDISGSPADLQIGAQGEIRAFRRYDIVGRPEVQLAVNCAARYHSPENTVSDIACDAPAGTGVMRARGSATAELPLRTADFALTAERVPMQAVVNAAMNVKAGLPLDLTAGGMVNASFTFHENGDASWSWAAEGKGEASEVRLRSQQNDLALALGKIPFSMENRKLSSPRGPTPGPRLDVGPITGALGRPTAVLMKGWFSTSGYNFSATGEGELKQILAAAQTLGLPAFQGKVEGPAKFDLILSGGWQGFVVPHVSGTAQLAGVKAEVRGLNAPLQIGSAKLLLADDATYVQNLTLSAGDAHLNGSLSVPRRCTSWPDCLVTFDLHSDTINAESLNELLNPNALKRPWYSLLTPNSRGGPSLLSVIRAEGKLSANKVVLGSLPIHQVDASLILQNAKLQLSVLGSEVLGARHAGDWTIDFSAGEPVYTGGGGLSGLALTQLAQLMHDPWITGIADAKYGVTMKGYYAADLLASAEGNATFTIRNGVFSHLSLGAGTASVSARTFLGTLALKDGVFAIQDGRLETAGGNYLVKGTASPGRSLDFKIVRDDSHSYAVGGTLSQPKVTTVAAPEPQSALKP